MQIYESAGYGQRDAARSILEHNLYGLDIDDRAFQMAYFAVMMKARQYNRRILTGEYKPNLYSIQESNGINRDQLMFFGTGLNEFEKNKAITQMNGLLDTFKDAKEYGSILLVDRYDWDLLDRFASNIEMVGQMNMYTVGLDDTVEKIKQMIAQGKVLVQKYHVATTNPPYMAVSKGNEKLNLYGDALDKYFRLGKNLNQRDTIAVRKMVGAFVKLLYPDGEFTKEEIEEILIISLEMRRRVKEQLKKLGGMEFYDVNFSYIDNESFEEKYVSVPEQGGGKLIPEGMCNPGQIYTVSRGKSGMIGVFRLESQMLPGNGKFDRTGLGSDRECREASNTAFSFLKANGNRISGAISTTTKDYIVNYQDLQGIGMTGKLALPTLIALCSIALAKPTVSSLAVLGEISISGTLIKVDELANALQVCLDSGAKKVLLPITSAGDLGTVPAELVGSFNLIFYSSAEDAVYKALGVE